MLKNYLIFKKNKKKDYSSTVVSTSELLDESELELELEPEEPEPEPETK
jgi:hypothetical protein